MKNFKGHCHDTQVGGLNNGGLLLQIGFCSFESCLVFFVKWFSIPYLWKVIFVRDFRIFLVLMNNEVISYITSCGVVPSYWHFGGTVLDDFLVLKMKAWCSSRTLVTVYQSAWLNIPKDMNCEWQIPSLFCWLCETLPNLSNEILSVVCWVYEAFTLVLPWKWVISSLCCLGS
jgi:hypothetical protein